MYGVELYQLALLSTNEQNSLMAEYFMNGTDEERIQLARGLGERGDPDINDFLYITYPQFRKNDRFKRDHFYLEIFSGLFREELPDRELEARIYINNGCLTFLFEHFPEIEDFYLKEKLLRLLMKYPFSGKKKLLNRELEKLINILRSDSEQNSIYVELTVLLDAMKNEPDTAFIEPLVQLIRVVSRKEIVNKAKIVIKTIKPL